MPVLRIRFGRDRHFAVRVRLSEVGNYEDLHLGELQQTVPPERLSLHGDGRCQILKSNTSMGLRLVSVRLSKFDNNKDFHLGKLQQIVPPERLGLDQVGVKVRHPK